jgi:hypothetical protein
MAVKPEDVRAHLATQAAVPDAAAPMSRAAATAPAPGSGVLASISASYFLLRRGLALLAFAFPILLWFGAGADHVQTSISAYYHYSAADSGYGAGTMRNVFVGVLWAIGAFLFFYKGYSWKEDWALNIGGVAAVLVSLFPMDWPVAADVVRTPTAWVHYGSAVVFFLTIAYVALFRSGDTLELVRDAQRRRRFKRTYALLGALMVLVPLGVVLLHLLARAERSLVVLLVEVAGIYVFSAFWLVKSREIALLEKQ